LKKLTGIHISLDFQLSFLTLNSDHFDQEVEASLRRSLPIISTPHAKSHLAHKSGENEAFTSVYALDAFNSMMVDVRPSFHEELSESHEIKKVPGIKVTAMPGKHVPDGILGHLNDLVKAVSSPT
jgi:hypothetical protein